MAQYFFEDDFDYKKYIRERLMEVSDLDDRRALKEVISNVIVPFYEGVNESYKHLEDKVFSNQEKGGFRVYTSMTRRNKLDLTNTTLFPICEEDNEENVIYVKDLAEAVAEKKSFRLYNILVNAEYRVIQKIIADDRVFRGIILTDKGEYPITVKLVKTEKYLNKLEELYHIFIKNNVRWNTVFAPYLYKMFDVYVISADYPEGESVIKVDINYEEIGEYIQYDCIPLWNITTKECRTSVYPDFCKDRIHYLHTLFGAFIKSDKEYLASGKTNIWSITRLKDEIQIQCDEMEPCQWTIKEFSKEIEEMDDDFEIFHNLGDINLQNIHTKAQIVHLIQLFGMQDILQLEDVRIADQINRYDTYYMEEFIIDEIRMNNAKQYLVVEFQKRTSSNLFTYDYMSYLITNLSRVYPEYYCVGILK